MVHMWQPDPCSTTETSDSVGRMRRFRRRVGAAILATVALGGCAGAGLEPSDLASPGGPAVAAVRAEPSTTETAPPPASTLRSAEDVRRIEADLLAAGARQQAEASGVRSRNVVDEMRALGRRHAAETRRRIEADSAAR